MFEEGSAVTTRRFVARVRALEVPGTEAELVELIGELEDLKAAAAAAQARAAERLDVTVRARHAAAGRPAGEQGRGVAAQVALARRESPSRGGQFVGLATALVREMPHALARLTEGALSEWRATLLVRETACLTREDRVTVDEELCADPATLDGVGDRELAGRARAVAYRLDPGAAVRRRSKAEHERRVTLRPAPDVMANLTALLPVAQGVAALAALRRAADEARSSGDSRTLGQLMADTLVERVTGLPSAGNVPVEVQLVMTDRALLGGDHEPAHVPGYGPVPARTARDLLRYEEPALDLADHGSGDAPASPAETDAARVWLRRLFTHPTTGELVALDSRARCFPPGLRRLIVARDRSCRTPWCDAPVRHVDHVRRRADGGPTSAANGQGLCEACNYAKEAPGWSAAPTTGGTASGTATTPAGTHAVTLTTPTGHRYTSLPPPQPGQRPLPPPQPGQMHPPHGPPAPRRGRAPTSPLELSFVRYLRRHARAA